MRPEDDDDGDGDGDGDGDEDDNDDDDDATGPFLREGASQASSAPCRHKTATTRLRTQTSARALGLISPVVTL